MLNDSMDVEVKKFPTSVLREQTHLNEWAAIFDSGGWSTALNSSLSPQVQMKAVALKHVPF